MQKVNFQSSTSLWHHDVLAIIQYHNSGTESGMLDNHVLQLVTPNGCPPWNSVLLGWTCVWSFHVLDILASLQQEKDYRTLSMSLAINTHIWSTDTTLLIADIDLPSPDMSCSMWWSSPLVLCNNILLVKTACLSLDFIHWNHVSK